MVPDYRWSGDVRTIKECIHPRKGGYRGEKHGHSWAYKGTAGFAVNYDTKSHVSFHVSNCYSENVNLILFFIPMFMSSILYHC